MSFETNIRIFLPKQPFGIVFRHKKRIHVIITFMPDLIPTVMPDLIGHLLYEC